MKEKAKALVGSNKNEPPAARKLEVSLDRADNVIECGAPFAPLSYAKGGGLESTRSANTAKYNPSFLLLTLVSISTNIQRLGNVLA